MTAHILIVDDNQFNRHILSRHLLKMGYTYDMAANGQEALEQLAERPFDVVLLDIMMPEVDGYQVLQKMQAHDQWHNIPVIMISALDDMENVVKCIQLGAADHLPKPFDRALLTARINASLSKKRLLDAQRAHQLAIHEREERLRAILETAPNGIITIDEQMIIKTVNPVMVDIFGYQLDDFTDLPITTIIPNFAFSYFEHVSTQEFMGQHADGHKFPIDVAISKVHLDSQIAFTAIIRDITSQKEVQKALQQQKQESERRARQQGTLYHVLQTVSKERDIDTVAKTAVDTIHLVTGWKHVVILFPDKSENFLYHAASAGIIPANKSIQVPMDQSISGQVYRTGTAKQIDDLFNHTDRFSKSPEDVHSAIVAPINYLNKCLAILIIGDSDVNAFDYSDLQLIIALGETIGLAMNNSQSYAALKQEQQRAEKLLLNILPANIASQLKQGQSPIADTFEHASVLFADLVNFTPFAAAHSVEEMLDILNTIFSTFDQLTRKYNLEKIKTIGDAYMVAAGVPISQPDHARRIVDLAIDMQICIKMLNEDYFPQPFAIRIGISSGPVRAGVIGTQKFSYDLWGDTVNLASRMESHGLANSIMISPTTYDALPQDKYEIEPAPPVNIKGKGIMNPYFVIGHTPA
ncbi:MAG TPA: adenylate/guanylate cyclase domain-containing protein [Anaerolineae bacterium]|nr:adenylate/guanylate cyclase domain-containing protein [Anaerolineae bacterium]